MSRYSSSDVLRVKMRIGLCYELHSVFVFEKLLCIGDHYVRHKVMSVILDYICCVVI